MASSKISHLRPTDPRRSDAVLRHCDGRIIACNKPIVTRTTGKFDAPRLMKAIVDHVEYHSFTSTDLKEYADELTHHIKAEELQLAIGDMSALELGRSLKLLSIDGENFGGYYVKHERRETEGVVWRIYPSM